MTNLPCFFCRREEEEEEKMYFTVWNFKVINIVYTILSPSLHKVNDTVSTSHFIFFEGGSLFFVFSLEMPAHT